MTKGSGGKTGKNGGTPVQTPAKAAGPSKKYSPSPKKEKEGKKADVKKIVIVLNPDATPFGWAFHGSTMQKSFLNPSLTGMARPPTLEAKYTSHSPICQQSGSQPPC